MKCSVLLLSLAAAALLMPADLSAQAPSFKKEEFIKANGSPIQLSIGHADPCVVDWDGDQVKDLLVGQFSSGKIRFYKNSGTNGFPILTTFDYLQADGTDIVLPSG
ncbi:MAG: hypothetical protein ACYTG7_05770 [Planctomycetota bacterium]|jgi:hypothetical protein